MVGHMTTLCQLTALDYRKSMPPQASNHAFNQQSEFSAISIAFENSSEQPAHHRRCSSSEDTGYAVASTAERVTPEFKGSGSTTPMPLIRANNDPAVGSLGTTRKLTPVPSSPTESTPLFGPVASEEAVEQDSPLVNAGGATIYFQELRILTIYALPVFGFVFTRSHSDPIRLTINTRALLLEYSLVIVSVISIGHLSTTALAAVSLGSMTATVSGLSVIQGFVSALDTMLPSAWTSSQPQLVGLWTQRMSLSAQPPSSQRVILTSPSNSGPSYHWSHRMRLPPISSGHLHLTALLPTANVRDMV